MEVIRLTHPSRKLSGSIQLNGSKSISNRALIIRALSHSDFEIENLSNCDDTKILNRLLSVHDTEVYDVGHAGTSFRFLTSYLCLKKGTQILTGSDRMTKRPIGPLVDSLLQLGAKIEYVDKYGFPPLKIHQADMHSLKNNVTIDAGISSQYLTALILIAPVLPRGLTIHLKGNLVSESYLKLTLDVISKFGIEYLYKGAAIHIPCQEYRTYDFQVEADWSACSYFYAFVALAMEAKIEIHGLFEKSAQGDASLISIGKHLGISSYFIDEVLHLEKESYDPTFVYDFINQPDLTQTVAVICAAKNIHGLFSGLSTLKIKETNRIFALDHELGKLGSGFSLSRGIGVNEEYEVKKRINFSSHPPRFATYDDHRMAMSFAPLALLDSIEIEEPQVVDKSYPNFWKDLESIGFVIQPVSL